MTLSNQFKMLIIQLIILIKILAINVIFLKNFLQLIIINFYISF